MLSAALAGMAIQPRGERTMTDERYRVQSLGRALDLLDRIADSGQAGARLTDLARDIGLSKPAAYAILATLRARGVVTDIGGVLSHGSIVAREYGIPAVLGVGVATRTIHTGDLITVDGAAGTVRLPSDGSDTDDDSGPEQRRNWVPLVLAGGVVAAVAARAWYRRSRRRER